jgi:hypothetical protein
VILGRIGARERAIAEELARRESLAQRGVTATVRVAPRTGDSIGLHGVVARRELRHLPSLSLGSVRGDDLLVTVEDRAFLGRDALAATPWLLHGPLHEVWLLARTP